MYDFILFTPFNRSRFIGAYKVAKILRDQGYSVKVVDFIQKIKPVKELTAEERRVSETYGVRSDTSATARVQQAQIIQQQQLELEKYRAKNKVGRPRKVGRPKKSKINLP